MTARVIGTSCALALTLGPFTMAIDDFMDTKEKSR
jgi:hypothetical protein